MADIQQLQQTNVPWTEQQQFLKDLWGRASEAMWKTPTAPYTGNFFASANPFENQAIGSTVNLAQNTAGKGQGLIDTGANWASGGYAQDPTFQAAVGAALAPMNDQFTRSVMPQIRSASIAEGAYGGSRKGENIAASEHLRRVGDVGSQMAWQAQMMAPELMKSGIAIEGLAPQLMTQAGGMQRQLDQMGVDNSLAKFQETIQAPWRGLAPFSAAISGNYGGTSTQDVQVPSQGANLIQGALGGAGLGAALGQLTGAQGLGGYAPFLGVGGILGALGGLFG